MTEEILNEDVEIPYTPIKGLTEAEFPLCTHNSPTGFVAASKFTNPHPYKVEYLPISFPFSSVATVQLSISEVAPAHAPNGVAVCFIKLTTS